MHACRSLAHPLDKRSAHPTRREGEKKEKIQEKKKRRDEKKYQKRYPGYRILQPNPPNQNNALAMQLKRPIQPDPYHPPTHPSNPLETPMYVKNNPRVE